ncbi:hypothetical protein [Sphingobium yanoikuyae]|nr:hypothetical protein [Sphingobium yanoikuyae]
MHIVAASEDAETAFALNQWFTVSLIGDQLAAWRYAEPPIT